MRNKKRLLVCLSFFLVSCTKEKISLEKNYTNFKILKLTLSKIPFLNSNGYTWDIQDGPDVFFNIERSDGSILFKGSEFKYSDLTSTELPYMWDIIPAYEITNITAKQFVTIYDYDMFDPNDEIGYVEFALSDHKITYPKIITETKNNITITIEGEWY